MICKYFVDNIFKQAWAHFFFFAHSSNMNNYIYY